MNADNNDPCVSLGITTPYNVGLVLWWLFTTLEVVQYIGRYISTVGDIFSTVEVVQYSGGITSVHVGITSVLWRVFSAVEGYLQHCGVTVVHVGDSFSTVGIPSVLWRLFSTVVLSPGILEKLSFRPSKCLCFFIWTQASKF